MSDKRIIILGAGESGTGAAWLAARKGFDVFVSDANTITEKYKNVLLHAGIGFEEKRHTENRVLEADEIIKSPGIPDTHPLVIKAQSLGIPVISEIEFAGRYCTAHKTCITGSNGKTTTSLLTWHILKRAGLNVGLGGNIGKSFAYQVAEEQFDYYVLEISSFQLDGMIDFKADTAVLLNITPDHLDRYQYEFQNYVNSKFRIIQNQSAADAFIFNTDDEVIRRELEKRKIHARQFPFSLQSCFREQGAFIKDNKLNINIQQNITAMTLEALALQGRHNVYNSMAAGIAARLLDIRKETVQECLSDFQNIEHRLEYVANIHGIEFVNDSKATNVNSAWYALESMEKPVVWIVGGVDKGNDYAILQDIVAKKVKAIVCLGIDNNRILENFRAQGLLMYEARSMEEAVALSYRAGKPGDVVLLSPACASFDLFKNYEERGDLFKEAVRGL